MTMPTYEYVCTECGAPLEVVQSIHEPSLTECPACHGRLRKVFGNVGVVFKGSGFYRTDSRGKASATSPAAPKPDAKSDAKPDASTPAASTAKPAGSAAPAPAPASTTPAAS
jgi:putative FmdB family regulatory protein